MCCGDGEKGFNIPQGEEHLQGHALPAGRQPSGITASSKGVEGETAVMAPGRAATAQGSPRPSFAFIHRQRAKCGVEAAAKPNVV